MLALHLLSEGGEGPNTALMWLLLTGMGFFFLIIIVGWWSSSRKQSEPEVAHEAHHSPELEKAPDDLVKLEGIGPKVAKVLNGGGIKTFEMLANSKVADIQKLLNEAGLQMMNPEGWIEQAKLAAKEDWKALEKMQGELKGGRRK